MTKDIKRHTDKEISELQSAVFKQLGTLKFSHGKSKTGRTDYEADGANGGSRKIVGMVVKPLAWFLKRFVFKGKSTFETEIYANACETLTRLTSDFDVRQKISKRVSELLRSEMTEPEIDFIIVRSVVSVLCERCDEEDFATSEDKVMTYAVAAHGVWLGKSENFEENVLEDNDNIVDNLRLIDSKREFYSKLSRYEVSLENGEANPINVEEGTWLLRKAKKMEIRVFDRTLSSKGYRELKTNVDEYLQDSTCRARIQAYFNESGYEDFFEEELLFAIARFVDSETIPETAIPDNEKESDFKGLLAAEIREELEELSGSFPYLHE